MSRAMKWLRCHADHAHEEGAPTVVARTFSRLRLRRVAVALALVVTVPLAVAGAASADPTAATDDRSVSVPTQWWTYTNLTEQQVADRINTNHARLTDVEVYSATAKTFTVTMVRNSGAYGVPAWWWSYNKTEAEVASLLASNHARLIDIEPYDAGGGAIRFAVVMVDNTGSFARFASWDGDASSAQVQALADGGFWRLQHLQSYVEGGVKKYAYIAVANTGADQKTWEWWLNLSPASVAAKVREFGGRIVDLERQADGTYTLVQVKNNGTEWGFHFGLGSLTATNLQAVQYANRVVHVGTYVAGGVRRYDAVMIDNANSETRRITSLFAPTFTSSNGLARANFGAYVKRVGGEVVIGLQPSRQFEPASAIKAVHNLHVMRLVQSVPPGEDLSNPFVYYDYPNSPSFANTKDACTIASDEVPANLHVKTVDWGKDQMMSISDNRTTRGFVLRYGLDALNATAHGPAGMASTQIDQDQPGCGWLDGKHNRTTLADLGRLYERVENGSLLNSAARAEFYQPMNGGSIAGGALADIVQQEAAKQGKSAIAASFIAETNWRFKGGSYDMGCPQPGCTTGSLYLYFRSIAGRITLPIKTGASTFGTRNYVFGRYVDSLNIGCTGCITPATADAALATVTPELFRKPIADALKTW